jgi:hypothetical protein
MASFVDILGLVLLRMPTFYDHCPWSLERYEVPTHFGSGGSRDNSQPDQKPCKLDV